jgi:hypothetical protein
MRFTLSHRKFSIITLKTIILYLEKHRQTF